MLFTSGEFLFIYLPIVVAGFYLLAHLYGNRIAAAWLVLASLVFYGFWRPEHTVLLLASIAFNYVLGSQIQTHSAVNRLSRKTLLVIGVTVNLLALCYYKYAGFLISTFDAVTGAGLPVLETVLPIGISFFTFTQIAYLVDSYAGKVREPNPMHYALFVTYFPHLISGPVLHHAEMMPQFAAPETYVPRLRNFVMGLAFLLLGLAKKVLLADSAAPLANDVFNAPDMTQLTIAEAWQGALAYTLQIYFDFSGYSDMAIGLSLIIGVRLPYNFDSPYKSRSIIDFWRRWHMTLSRFLRDYLYFALGGNRLGSARRYMNLAITMLLGGLWHGASWTFVIWGALHGCFLIINHGWRHVAEVAKKYWKYDQHVAILKAGDVASLVLTLTCVVVAWIFFRAASVDGALQLLQVMFGTLGNPGDWSGVDSASWGWLIAGLLFVVLSPNSQELLDRGLTFLLQRFEPLPSRHLLQGAFVGFAFIVISLFAMISASREVSEFIYFNF